MAEQYIYSRSESGFANALGQATSLGHGFVALSPGMDQALKEAVTVHCGDCPCPPQRDGQGVRLPLLRKACLPGGQILLQKSAWIEDEGRPFHVAHGYVLESGEAEAAGPEGWLDAPFRLENPNLTPGGILLDSLPGLPGGPPFRPRSLREAVGPPGLGLSSRQFCRLLLACFDVSASRSSQLLIAYDFETRAGQDLRPSVLYWIYACLPPALWDGLSFDSVYTGKSAPGLVRIAFADRASVQAGGGPPFIQVEKQTVALESRFLLLDGELIHNDSKYTPAWYNKGGVYARWLEQLVDTLWECPPEEQDSVLQALSEFCRSLQAQLDAMPGEKQPDPERYGAACWSSLEHPPQALAGACARARDSVTESERRRCSLMLMDRLTENQRREILEDILQSHETPAGTADIDMLRVLSENGLASPAAELLSAFIAEEAGLPGTSLTAVLGRYRELLPPELCSRLPGRLFFFRPDTEEAPLWARCRAEYSAAAAKRRREAWYEEALPEGKNIWDLPSRAGQALAELRGSLEERQLADIWQEPLRKKLGEISKDSLREFADETLPARLQQLERDLSRLPGGMPEGLLDPVWEKACELLLERPMPFMDSRWLRGALDGRGTGGEAEEALSLLAGFTDRIRGGPEDAEIWESRAREYGTVRKRVFRLLPEMFLAGTLPEIWSGFVVSFLHLAPEKRREILLQAAGQGGGALLLDILRYSREYERELEPGGITDLLAILRAAAGDEEIWNKAAERDGGSAEFCEGLEAFLRERKTQEALPSGDISLAAGCIRRHCPSGKHRLPPARRNA